MKYVTRIVTVVQESFYGPERYQRAAVGTASRGISYALLAATIAMLSFVGLMLVGIGALLSIDTSRAAVERVYPGELEVVIADGHVSTNVAEPYYLRVDDMADAFGFSQDDSAPIGQESYEHLLVIDTTRELTMDDVIAYDAHVVLGEQMVFFRKDDAEMRSYDLASAEDMTVNRETVVTFLEGMRPYLYAGIAFFTLIIAGFFVLFCSIYFFVLAVPAALIVKLISKIQGVTISFGGAYAVSLLVFIATSLISALAAIVSFGIPFVVYCGLFCLLVMINMKQHSLRVDTTQSSENNT